MDDYKRGDVIDLEKARAIKTGKTIQRGEAIEELLQSNGWKYIKEHLEILIDAHKRNIETMIMQRADYDRLIDMQITVRAYEFLLGLPNEWVSAKNIAVKNKGGE
jgi:Zn-dependent M32 family carboxypeptidase